jgi:predicted membrane protein (TIGR00267 family)
MSGMAWFFRREHTFALLIGVVDGILTALTLAAGRVVSASNPIDAALALRIPVASALSGAFVFFVAEYARIRGELVRAERQLNLTTHGRLATTQLGRAVLHETAGATVVSVVCNFLGASIPLITAAMIPGAPWLSIAVANVVLGALGLGIARAIYGSAIRWAVMLMLAGSLLTLVGIELRIT